MTTPLTHFVVSQIIPKAEKHIGRRKTASQYQKPKTHFNELKVFYIKWATNFIEQLYFYK